ncbi:PIR Superfamily Protein [Plasmodium ovale curtisi]|uniref:PIR Superfamily Protein n=1 Tax=Plasmodium ovale curtisi TaxID=864141 RepID=A0A1A8WI17_PLAOA|nr:PIR Superfamily Protein [Plasmodium ovale curtisi]
MDTNSIDHFFEKWHERYTGLMSFPLYLMYRTFSTYYSYIPNGVDICSHTIPKNTPHYNIILSVCRVPIKLLSQLIIYLVSVNSQNFTIGEKAFNNKKKIYFNSEILYWIKKKSLYSDFYIEKYNKLFDDCINDYNEIINGDYCEYVEHYEPVLDKFSNNFEETKLSLKGTQLKISTQDIKLKPKPSCAENNMSNIPGESEPLPEQGDLQSLTAEEQFNSDTLPVQIPNNEKGKTIGILLGILFGIFLLFIFVYKFTPFGLWLYHKIKTHERINLDDKNNDLIFNTCGNENMNSYKEIYNITYQSA